MADTPITDPTVPVDEGAKKLAYIAAQLAAHARGEKVDQLGLMEACTLVVAAQLIAAGMSFEAVERQFADRDHTFRIAYEPDDEGEWGLVVEVVWLDEDGDSTDG